MTSKPIPDLGAPKAALARGDYRQALNLLAPLADQWPGRGVTGAELRLLMATAHQGLGQDGEAQACCRAALACADSTLRRQAQEVLCILEAPQLQRPKEWNLTMPSLGEMPSLLGRSQRGGGSGGRKPAPPPPAPPVGRTRSPWGFALVATSLLLGLTLLLGGCVKLDTTLQFHGPGRLELVQQLQNRTGAPLPMAANQASGLLLAPQLAPLLERQVQQATNLLDLELPAPQLRWRERNWLLGVQQRLEFEWDLRPLDSLPGLELRLHLQPLKLAAVRTALPAAAQVEASETVGWSLQAGALNQLALGCWRWSGLGLGALGVALLLGLSLLLQRLQARA